MTSPLHWMLLPLKRYAQFRGRSTRREFWLFVLFQLLVFRVLRAITRPLLPVATGAEFGDPHSFWLLVIFAPVALFFALPTLAVTARRMQDHDQSGWGCLAILVPYLGALAILVLMCLPGTRGPNRFGPDPRGRSALAPDLAKVFE